MTTQIYAVVAAVIMSLPAAAWADLPLECKDIESGNVAACKDRVKRECTSDKYWDRRGCEHAIVEQMDLCLAKKDEIDQVCTAARELESQVCGARLNLDEGRDHATNVKSFVDAANALDGAMKKHAATQAQYGQCRGCS